MAGRNAAGNDAAGNEGDRGSLTVLGCDGSYPGPGGACSGYLVRGGGATVWLDAGAGTFAALQLVADPRTVDAVVLSHEHPDHWIDVDSFAAWRRGAGCGRPVAVYAPPGLRNRSYFGGDPTLAWHQVEPSWRVAVRGVEAPATGGGSGLLLSFCATDHGPPTLGVRIEHAAGDRSAGLAALGYTADTGPDWSAEELGPGIGLLLCEATYTSEHEGEGRHLSGRQAGGLAAAAGVGRLVLTHRRPSTDAAALEAEAATEFGAPVEQAAVNRVFLW